MKNFVTSLLLFAFFSLSTCASFNRLRISSPEGLAQWMGSLTNLPGDKINPFGHTPWGRKIVGRLVLSTPYDACDTITFEEKPSGNFILVAQRGGCDLYIKAQNAQKTGTKMLIIVDKAYFDQAESSEMPSEPIDIPSVIVPKVVGDRLIEDLSMTDEKVSRIEVVYDFTTFSRRSIDYMLMLSSYNRESFRFLKEWKPHYDILQNVTGIQVYYPYASINNKECECDSYCIGPGDKNLPLSAHDAMIEDARQGCIFNRLGKYYWWQYVLAYGELCLERTDVKECSSQIMKELHFDTKTVEACISSKGYCSQERMPIDMNPKQPNLPRFVIESEETLFNPLVLNFELICESLMVRPEGCTGVYDQALVNPNPNKFKLSSAYLTPQSSKAVSQESSSSFGLGYLILLTLVALVGLWFWRRHTKRSNNYNTQTDIMNAP